MAQIKLTEVWKSLNLADYPIQWMNRTEVMQKTGLKSSNKPDLITTGKTNLQDSTFINDAARIWNAAPAAIKSCETLFAVKKQIKIFVRTLPI